MRLKSVEPSMFHVLPPLFSYIQVCFDAQGRVHAPSFRSIEVGRDAIYEHTASVLEQYQGRAPGQALLSEVDDGPRMVVARRFHEKAASVFGDEVRAHGLCFCCTPSMSLSFSYTRLLVLPSPRRIVSRSTTRILVKQDALAEVSFELLCKPVSHVPLRFTMPAAERERFLDVLFAPQNPVVGT